MDMKLEVVIIPVSDVDRAKAFYEKAGFRLDIDYVANESFRVLQFTPPNSEASIIFGKGVTSATPGSIEIRAKPIDRVSGVTLIDVHRDQRTGEQVIAFAADL